MPGLDAPGFDALARGARGEGFRFIERLAREWHEGWNRFDGAGEQLLGAFENNLIVGLGGLNLDPYSGHARCARIRHLYVALQHNGRGIGHRIKARLLEAAETHFERVRLRSDTEEAAQSYQAHGFARVESTDATHEMSLPLADARFR